MWYELAIVSSIFAVGNILFGHFEEKTPKWRRLGKFLIFTVVALTISYYGGRKWFYIFLAVMTLFALVIHLWWLPKKGINPWTAEPKDKYYQLRGWKKSE